MATTEYMLQTESVIKQYRQSDSVITAVDRANIKIEKGEFVAIIGASGSGKSTFLHICAGLDRANAGRIIIDGQEITKMHADELGRFRGEKMGFIYQRHKPTGNLDRTNADEVLRLLLKIRETRGQTLLMVTHDLSIAEKADRIFRMDNGVLSLDRDYIGGNKKTIVSY